MFEPHTEIIIKDKKDKRDTQYGHKVSLATQIDGFVTYVNIEDGNPSDQILYLPVVEKHYINYRKLPESTVADGGYASQSNCEKAREKGVKRVVLHKRVGLRYHDMGVKRKTFDRLRNFRTGNEGNISELKRACGMGKATWKGLDGFKAYVWSSVLSYNLLRMVRFSSGQRIGRGDFRHPRAWFRQADDGLWPRFTNIDENRSA